MLEMKDVRPLVFGGLIKEEKPGVFGFSRFTARQIRYFAGDKKFSDRVRCSAGICMDFYTDSSFLSLEYEAHTMADRDILQMDVYQNQVLRAFMYESPAVNTKGALSYQLHREGKALSRITVWFPYMSQIRIRNINLSDGAVIKPLTEKRKKLLALGDSITQGYDACHPSQTYAARFARFFDMELWNAGISGHVFDADTLDGELPFKPDVVTCAYGTNDWNKAESKEKLFEHAGEYFDKLLMLYPQSEHYYIAPLWRNDTEKETQIGSFWEMRKGLMKLAEEKGIFVVDGVLAVPNVPEAFADRNLHPTDNGMACYSEYLAKMYLKRHREDRKKL